MKEKSLRSGRKDWERDFLLAALRRHAWNQTKTAQALGIHRNSLILKMRDYKLRREKERNG